MMDFAAEVDQLLGELEAPPPQRSGTLVRLVGMRLETRGLMAPLGACCEVIGQFGHRVEAEVVGFNDDILYLLPFTEPQGIAPGAQVRVVHNTSQVCLGPALLGRILDGRGQPLDGQPAPECRDVLALQGAEDAYGTMQQIDDIQSVAGRITRYAVPACGHSPHRDQPEEVLKQVLSFLQDKA